MSSWIDTRESQPEKANLTILFEKYVPSCLESMRLRFKQIIPVTEISHLQMLCSLLECLLVPYHTPSDCPKEWFVPLNRPLVTRFMTYLQFIHLYRLCRSIYKLSYCSRICRTKCFTSNLTCICCYNFVNGTDNTCRYELYFVFACIWAFGGCLFQDQVRFESIHESIDAQISSFLFIYYFKTIKFSWLRNSTGLMPL